MAENSKISWTDHTFNPWIGCSKVHTGCANCYAETLMDSRLGKAKWGQHGTRVLTSDANWREPLKWNREPVVEQVTPHRSDGTLDLEAAVAMERRPRVFCASLADVFEEWDGPVLDHNGGEPRMVVPTKQIATFMGPDDGLEAPQFGDRAVRLDDVRHRLFRLIDDTPNLDWLLLTKRPERIFDYLQKYRHNVWLGTSVSDQDTANDAVDKLVECCDLSPVLFLSVEPLTGPVDLTSWLMRDPSPIGWVIIGGESGPNARPCDLKWIRSIVAQCDAAGVPCFVKQMGAVSVNSSTERGPWPFRPAKTLLWSGKGENVAEWPADLQVQQFPKGGAE